MHLGRPLCILHHSMVIVVQCNSLKPKLQNLSMATAHDTILGARGGSSGYVLSYGGMKRNRALIDWNLKWEGGQEGKGIA